MRAVLLLPIVLLGAAPFLAPADSAPGVLDLGIIDIVVPSDSASEGGYEPAGAEWTADDRIVLGFQYPAYVVPYVLDSGCSFMPLQNGTSTGTGAVSFRVPDVGLLEGMQRPYVFAPEAHLLYREGYATMEIWDPPELCTYTYGLGGMDSKTVRQVEDAIGAWTMINPIFSLSEASAGAPDFEIAVEPSPSAMLTHKRVHAFLDAEILRASGQAAGPPANSTQIGAGDLAGEVVRVEAFARGGSAYLAAVEGDAPRVRIFDVAVPANSSLVSTLHADMSISDVAVRGDLMLVADWKADSVAVYDASDPKDVSLLSVIRAGEGGFDHVDAPAVVDARDIGGSTFAFVAGFARDSLTIVDLGDPRNPSPASALVADKAGLWNLRGISAIEFVENGAKTFALASTSQGLMGIIDVTDPYDPRPVPFTTYGDSGAYGDPASGMDSMHMAVYRQGSLSYALIASLSGNGVHILNVTDPESATGVGFVSNGDAGFGSLHWPGRVGIHGDTAVILNSLGGGGAAVSLANVTSPEPVPGISGIIGPLHGMHDVTFFSDAAKDAYMVLALSEGAHAVAMPQVDP